MRMDELRMRLIAQRLICLEGTDALSQKTREALSKAIEARWNAHDGALPW